MAVNYSNAVGRTLLLSAASTKTYVSTKAGDTLVGTSGNDTFRSTLGASTLSGGVGDDTYVISTKTDKIIEALNGGIDTIRSSFDYTLPANVENLTLEGTQSWYGGGNALDNIITGNASNNQIDGGAGNDLLIGGGGNDIFIVSKGNGSDVIADFTSGDKIRLNAYGYTSFAQVQQIAYQVGNDTVLRLTSGESLTLRGVKASTLTADNFQIQLDTSKFKQTFSDDFNSLSLYSKGGTWRTEFGNGGPGTVASHSLSDEQSIYIDPDWAGTGTKALGVNPFSISNGVLSITAAPTSADVLPYVAGHTYTGGLLTSKFTFSQEYGYFEARVAMPAGQGFYSAFWLLPVDNSWPPEIDIFEQLGRDSSTVYMTSHDTVNGVHVYTQALAKIDTTQFHTYAVNWTAKNIDYYIDGTLVASQVTPDSMKKEAYILINQGAGGSWIGNTDSTTGTGAMKIDYIKVLANQDTVSTTVNGVHTVYSAGTAVSTSVETAAVVTPPPPTYTNIYGTDAGEIIKGTGVNNEIWGGAGNDAIYSGTGANNILHGGLGDDQYHITKVGDIVQENVGEGTDAVYTTITYTLTDNVETLVLDGTASINGTGNDLNNRIIGNSGDNVLTGGAGNDILDGGTGGHDTLIGGTGDDYYYVARADTILIEKAGEGTDSVSSSISWTLGDNFENLALTGTAALNGTGNALDNRITGNAGDNILNGGAGNDMISGGAGNDTIIGGTGDDILTGGAGKDVFTFSATGFGRDRITDFNAAEDSLNFHGLNKADMHIVQSGDNTVITFGTATDSVTLIGVKANDPLLASHIFF